MKFGLRKVATDIFDPFDPTIAECSTSELRSVEAHQPQAATEEIGILGLAAFKHNVLKSGIGKIHPGELAVNKHYTLERTSRKIGIRQIAVAKDNIRELRLTDRAA